MKILPLYHPDYDYRDQLKTYLSPMRKEKSGKSYGVARTGRVWWTHQIFIPDEMTDRMPIGNFQSCAFVISPYLDWNHESLMASDDVYLAGAIFYFPDVSPLAVLAYGMSLSEEESK